MWQELEIARTTDAKAVRRAYAARLRSIDVDADPAAFRRLRSAYESALAYCTRFEHRQRQPVPAAEPSFDDGWDDDDFDDDEDEDGDEDEDEDGRATSTHVSHAQPREEDAGSAQVQSEIAALLRGGQSRAAVNLLNTAVAQGHVGLGERERAVDWVMSSVVADKTLSAAEYFQILALIGWDKNLAVNEVPTRVRRVAMERTRAERWYIDIERFAGTQVSWWSDGRRAPDRWHGLKDSWLATKLLVRGEEASRLRQKTCWSVPQLLKEFDQYRSWIGHRVDPTNLAKAEDIARSKTVTVERRKEIVDRQKYLQRLVGFGVWALVCGLVTAASILWAVAMLNPILLIFAIGAGRLGYVAVKELEALKP